MFDVQKFTALKLLPPVLVLEPTSRCNMTCDMCPQSKQDTTGDMDTSLALDVVSQVEGYCEYIQCYFLGEPTVRKDICEFISRIRAKTNAKIEVSTNLIRFKDERFIDEFLQCGVDKILCCVEGFTAESHHQLRRTGDYSASVRSVQKLGLRSVALGGRVEIVAKCILNRSNEPEIAEYENFWNAQVGVNARVTWLNTWAGTMPNVRGYAVKMCPNGDIPRRPCAELWNKLVVRWDGNVVLCCHDWRSAVVIGNVRDESLMALWSGPVIGAIREKHLSGVYDGICGPCIEWSTPEEFVSDYGLDQSAITIINSQVE